MSIQRPLVTTLDVQDALIQNIQAGTLEARELLRHCCRLLYERYPTLEEVARRTHLDRRTVKKYINQWNHPDEEI